MGSSFAEITTSVFGPLRLGAKKTDVEEHPGVFGHVGLLVNGPPGSAGLPFS